MARIAKKPDERRSELIACAQNLFYSKGYKSTSVRDIVDEAGVAKGTFYYYFDSKSAILEATIDELIAQSETIVQAIVENKASSATEKWNQAFQLVGNWKTERKAELIPLMQMMQNDENALLQNKTRSKSIEMMAPYFTRIIKQGIEEGVFDTDYADDAAAIALAMMLAISDTVVDVVLYPDKYENPPALVQRKFSAVQASTERVLGAAPGSLPYVDPQTFVAWFEVEPQRQREKVL